MPLSEARASVGALPGALGARVSTMMCQAGGGMAVLPAASVEVAVSVWLPSASLVVAMR